MMYRIRDSPIKKSLSDGCKLPFTTESDFIQRYKFILTYIMKGRNTDDRI